MRNYGLSRQLTTIFGITYIAKLKEYLINWNTHLLQIYPIKNPLNQLRNNTLSEWPLNKTETANYTYVHIYISLFTIIDDPICEHKGIFVCCEMNIQFILGFYFSKKYLAGTITLNQHLLIALAVAFATILFLAFIKTQVTKAWRFNALMLAPELEHFSNSTISLPVLDCDKVQMQFSEQFAML